MAEWSKYEHLACDSPKYQQIPVTVPHQAQALSVTQAKKNIPKSDSRLLSTSGEVILQNSNNNNNILVLN